MKLNRVFWCLESFIALGLLAMPCASMGNFPSAMAAAHPGLAHTISLGDLTLTGVYPRIFSPNGDGANDKVGFHFDNPEDLPVAGAVYSLTGTQVANLQPGSDAASLLLWDGKDSNGRTAPGGIYLYKIEFEGKTATGTVVLAR